MWGWNRLGEVDSRHRETNPIDNLQILYKYIYILLRFFCIFFFMSHTMYRKWIILNIYKIYLYQIYYFSYIGRLNIFIFQDIKRVWELKRYIITHNQKWDSSKF